MSVDDFLPVYDELLEGGPVTVERFAEACGLDAEEATMVLEEISSVRPEAAPKKKKRRTQPPRAAAAPAMAPNAASATAATDHQETQMIEDDPPSPPAAVPPVPEGENPFESTENLEAAPTEPELPDTLAAECPESPHEFTAADKALPATEVGHVLCLLGFSAVI